MKKIFTSIGIWLFLTIFAAGTVWGMPLHGRTIVIDPGHGGWDPGKQTKGFPDEKEINLAIAEVLQMYLDLSGAVVFMTRTEDRALADRKNPDLEARARMIGEMGADIFVSIHQNAFPDESVRGPQVFYYDGSEGGARLAAAIQARMEDFLEIKKPKKPKADTNYFMLRKTQGPAVIVECGFLTSPAEATLLSCEKYQQKVAWGIYLGIVEYFTSK